jgi:hypothetical protein
MIISLVIAYLLRYFSNTIFRKPDLLPSSGNRGREFLLLRTLWSLATLDLRDINTKLYKFYRMCGTIRGNLKQKTLKSTQLTLRKVVAVPILNYSCEN